MDDKAVNQTGSSHGMAAIFFYGKADTHYQRPILNVIWNILYA